MRNSWVWCLVAVLAVCGVATQGAGAAAEAVETRAAAEVGFAERYGEVMHGGVASAANSVVTCGEIVTPGAPECAEARRGEAAGRGRDYEVAYIDVDDDANTYNSSTARLRLPRGARVTYARLYWGGNIRVGEQKPRGDNGRVLIAEPGGAYKELLADSAIGSRDAAAYEGFSASADVTSLVREAGPGSYTVGQINAAMGHSDEGGWGGWSLVAAYRDADEPLREVAILDGFETLAGNGETATVTVDGLRARPGGAGSVGVVAFGGDRGLAGDTISASGDAGGGVVQLGDAVNPPSDVMNSTVTVNGGHGREPDDAGTLGFDADVLDVSGALTEGPRRLRLRFGSGADAYQLGAVFLQAEARRA
jgi:hypothetical protein